MKKIFLVLLFVCLLFSGCADKKLEPKHVEDDYANSNRAYNITISEFKERYNAAVKSDNVKIENWSEPAPGIVECVFNDQIKLSLGISPNEKNLVYIPSLFSEIIEVEKIENFSEILFGVLSVEDNSITLKQAESIAEKISLTQYEIPGMDFSSTIPVKQEPISNISIKAIYVDKKMDISFLDSKISPTSKTDISNPN